MQFAIGLTVYLCHGKPRVRKSQNYIKLTQLADPESGISTGSSLTVSTGKNESDNEGSWHETTNLMDEFS